MITMQIGLVKERGDWEWHGFLRYDPDQRGRRSVRLGKLDGPRQFKRRDLALNAAVRTAIRLDVVPESKVWVAEYFYSDAGKVNGVRHYDIEVVI